MGQGVNWLVRRLIAYPIGLLGWLLIIIGEYALRFTAWAFDIPSEELP